MQHPSRVCVSRAHLHEHQRAWRNTSDSRALRTPVLLEPLPVSQEGPQQGVHRFCFQKICRKYFNCNWLKLLSLSTPTSSPSHSLPLRGVGVATSTFGLQIRDMWVGGAFCLDSVGHIHMGCSQYRLCSYAMTSCPGVGMATRQWCTSKCLAARLIVSAGFYGVNAPTVACIKLSV